MSGLELSRWLPSTLSSESNISLGANRSLFFFFSTLITAFLLLLRCLSLLPTYTTRTATSKWTGEGKVDMFLRVKTDDEGWDIHNLLADS